MILGLIASACGGVERRLRPELVEPAIRRGWTPAITLTPTAARWFEASGELDALRAPTELPVRWQSRLPAEPKPYPMPDAFLFAPASANSIAKLALGIADNQALTAISAEPLAPTLTSRSAVVGAQGIPAIVLPQVGDAQAGHPAFAGHLATLRAAGVHIVDQPA
ncbi:MAG: flavoprotein, partial [Sciscionella sp.]|nr:flavoprotein [Sciscionella sp.]